MRLSTVLSVPLLSAAVLAGPVADPTKSVPAKTLDPGNGGLPNPVTIFFGLFGAPPCSFGCIDTAIAGTPACTGVLNVACFCNPNGAFVTSVTNCAAGVCSPADASTLTGALQRGCGFVGVPI
ncbi:uncharacterized protein CDV56_105281 [Aspergillus thermomutatus]|uniref:CFEM domain-containing protein n=1 Tax=Aspergillus thermomutatus TaxID=41047 RepID=A0A397GHK6_ASPTH|nr:uncharacterized protein CDV56_105281 [Aspergillus thermomutatus]RHZ49188.1 hypothetical protein CDV56_105281 [Aspergillus thermomutatus]